jgi:glycerol-3-phosphate acyltransferase PlsX
MSAPAEGSLRRFSLAIDAMGGDRAPEAVLDGLELAAERHPQARFLLVGDEAMLAGLLATRRAPRGLRAAARPQHHPRRHEAHHGAARPPVLHAAGHRRGGGRRGLGRRLRRQHRALMALAKIVIKTMPEIGRPRWPPSPPPRAATW